MQILNNSLLFLAYYWRN